MTGEMIYMVETKNGNRPLEIRYEYIPGRRLNLRGHPDTWHPTEPPEVYIRWVKDTLTDLELTDKEWMTIVDEDVLVEEIITREEEGNGYED